MYKDYNMTQLTLPMETSVLNPHKWYFTTCKWYCRNNSRDWIRWIQTLSLLNIRKVKAQRAENNQKNYEKDNFYIISIEIVFFTYLEPFCTSFFLYENYKFIFLNSHSCYFSHTIHKLWFVWNVIALYTQLN